MRRISIPDRWTGITLGEHVGLDEGVTLKVHGEQHSSLIIRAGTYVNQYTIITAGERVDIGANCMIGPHCFISDAIHGTSAESPLKQQPMQFKPVIIEDGVWLGAGCIVLAGVRLGEGSIIGAGSVVTHDIPAGTIALSPTARVIKTRE